MNIEGFGENVWGRLYAQLEALTPLSRKIPPQSSSFTTNPPCAGQKISNADTLYSLLNNIKRFLLVKHSVNEEALNNWGFKVIIGSSSVGAKKKKKPH